MKIAFQTIIWKNKVLIFLKRHVLRRIFTFMTYQNLKVAIFQYRELRTGMEGETGKGPLLLQ